MKSWLVGVAAGAVVAVLGALLVGSSSYAVNYANYPGGLAWAQARDAECAQNYSNARQGQGQGAMRAIINASAYRDAHWLSPASNTGQAQIEIDAADTRPITLRINYANYICYPAVVPATNSLADIDARMSTPQARSGADYAPVAYEGYSNSPARTFYGFGLYGISVDGGSANGRISSYTPGAQVISSRDNGSRFWLTGTNFTYIPPAGGFTADTTVHVTASVAWINQYYMQGYRWWEISCVNGGAGVGKWNTTSGNNPQGHGNLPDGWYTGQCNRTTLPLSITFKVKNKFELTPKVTVGSRVSVAGAQVAVNPAVKNSGPTVSTPAKYQLVSFTIPANNTTDVTKMTDEGTSDPTRYYGFGAQNVSGANGTRTFAVNTGSGTSVATGNRAIPVNTAVGARVCWALAVQPYRHDTPSNEWRYGVPDCVVVSKRPVVQVMGGDLWVGRETSSSIRTNVTTVGGRSYGSWGEYGVVAAGSIEGMASARGYAGGTTKAMCGVSYLTFSNKKGTAACKDDAIGGYRLKQLVSTVANRFPVSGATKVNSPISVNDLSRGVTYTTASSETVEVKSASNKAIAPGVWFVINAPNATVKITSNIRYTETALTSIDQIPQAIIIAKNIIIADTVERVDAWLLATGTGANGRLNTCVIGESEVQGFTGLSAEVCNKKLTINGPVVANHLYLRRTHGAEDGARAGNPAEVFNLRPDAYLWASNLQQATPKAQTIMTTELPPRY